MKTTVLTDCRLRKGNPSRLSQLQNTQLHNIATKIAMRSESIGKSEPQAGEIRITKVIDLPTNRVEGWMRIVSVSGIWTQVALRLAIALGAYWSAR